MKILDKGCDFGKKWSIALRKRAPTGSFTLWLHGDVRNVGRCIIPNARKIHLFKITQLVVKSRGTPDHEISVMFMEIERATTSKKKY